MGLEHQGVMAPEVEGFALREERCTIKYNIESVQENKGLKKRVAELEDDRPMFETPAKPAGRLRVPMSVSPAPTPASVLDILVAERDKNDKFTLSFTKQLGDTFSQVAGAFNK